MSRRRRLETDGAAAQQRLVTRRSVQQEDDPAVAELAKKHHVELPMHVRYMDGVIKTRPSLQLSKLADRQKVFKLISDYAELVTKYGGVFVSESSEGRLKANAAYDNMDPEIFDLYSQIRTIFDPFGTLNPGVKQKNEMKTLIASLNADYSV